MHLDLDSSRKLQNVENRAILDDSTRIQQPHLPKRPPSKSYLVQGICWYSNRGVLPHGINLWVLLVLLRLKHKVCTLSLHHHQHLLLRIILQHILEI